MGSGCCARCNVACEKTTLVWGRFICDACYRRIDPCEKEHIALHEGQLEAWKTKLDEVVESKRVIASQLDDSRALLREITVENTELRSQLLGARQALQAALFEDDEGRKGNP